MAQMLTYRSNSVWHNDIIKWCSWLVLFVSAANELAAKHSNTWLVLAVYVAVRLRNPPTSPAPPVYICYEVIHVCCGGYFTYVICAAAVFLTCSQQDVVDVLAVISLGTWSDTTTRLVDLFCQDQFPLWDVMTELYFTVFLIKCLGDHKRLLSKAFSAER